MSVMRSILLVGGLALGAAAVVTGCGAPFSAATGTGGGTSSSTSSSSSSSTTGSSSSSSSATSTSSSSSSSATAASSSSSSSTSSSSGGQTCDGSTPCPAGAYCYFPGCTGSGTCVSVSGETAGSYAPLCGCSGETYWNGLLAAQAMAAIQIPGACVGAGHECMPGSTDCQIGFGAHAYCDVMVDSSLSCPSSVTSMPAGTCWVMPPTNCDPSPTGHPCGSLTCQTACALIEGQQPWVQTTCTP